MRQGPAQGEPQPFGTAPTAVRRAGPGGFVGRGVARAFSRSRTSPNMGPPFLDQLDYCDAFFDCGVEEEPRVRSFAIAGSLRVRAWKRFENAAAELHGLWGEVPEIVEPLSANFGTCRTSPNRPAHEADAGSSPAGLPRAWSA
jgi:hypothetical protein